MPSLEGAFLPPSRPASEFLLFLWVVGAENDFTGVFKGYKPLKKIFLQRVIYNVVASASPLPPYPPAGGQVDTTATRARGPLSRPDKPELGGGGH